jgi:hypothetical protein
MAIDKTKPRVAVYYDVLGKTGMRDDGCPLFINWNLRKILNGAKNLNALSDHNGNVVHLSPIGPADFGTFDLNVLVDYGEDALDIPLDWEIPHPNAYWVSDAHLGFGYRADRAKQFDHVFVAQKACIEPFVKEGIAREKIHYLPHAFEPDVYRPVATINKWDWVFVGHPNSEHRIDLLDRFIKAFPNYYLGWRMGGWQGHNELEDVNLKYNQSKIVINDAIGDDLNMRVFETLGAGRCLITQDISEMNGEFEGGLAKYKTLEEAVELGKELLANDEKREAIAKRGHEIALAGHTYNHRALTILKTCLNYEPKGELLPC